MGDTKNQSGNSVWKWATDSGRHLIESTSALLKRLDVPGLKLEEDVTGKHKGQGKALDDAGGGYDPYGGKRGGAASPPRPAARAAQPTSAARPTSTARPSLKKPAAALPARRSWWRRLFGRD